MAENGHKTIETTEIKKGAVETPLQAMRRHASLFLKYIFEMTVLNLKTTNSITKGVKILMLDK